MAASVRDDALGNLRIGDHGRGRAELLGEMQRRENPLAPSRGQPLIPVLYSISTVPLPQGSAAEVYLATSKAGVNQFHLIFTEGAGATTGTIGAPRVVASRVGGTTMALRLVHYGPEHYISYAVFGTGTWRFHVSVDLDGRARSFVVSRVLS